MSRSTVVLRDLAGRRAAPDAARWWGPADDVDQALLAEVAPPVLDVGCGPGRHVAALLEQGVPALGIDVAAGAVGAARRRGALALERSVFDRVPGHGRWGTVLLLDGNVGIGGDTGLLLARCAQLLAPGGRVLVECAPPGGPADARVVRLEVLDQAGPWFRLARLPADRLPAAVAGSGLRVHRSWALAGRHFARLDRGVEGGPA